MVRIEGEEFGPQKNTGATVLTSCIAGWLAYIQAQTHSHVPMAQAG